MLLIAPAAFHRMIYRRRLKQQLVRIANRLALFGLLLLLATMGSALLLIFDVVIGMYPAMVLTTGTLAWFVTWWFILPVWTRIRHQSCDRIGDTNRDLPGCRAPSRPRQRVRQRAKMPRASDPTVSPAPAIRHAVNPLPAVPCPPPGGTPPVRCPPGCARRAC